MVGGLIALVVLVGMLLLVLVLLLLLSRLLVSTADVESFLLLTAANRYEFN